MLSGLFAFLMANPVVAVIGVVIAALVLLYNNCEWFRDGVNEIISAVIGFFQNFGENVQNLCTNIALWWDGVKADTAAKWEEIKTDVSEKWDALVSGAMEKFESIRATVSEKWENLKAATAEQWANINTSVAESAESIRSSVVEKFTSQKTRQRNSSRMSVVLSPRR